MLPLCRSSKRSRRFAFIAIAALLWLNFAFIDHQYDRAGEHHQHHHCQLFACALHGAGSATAQLSLPTPIEPFMPSGDNSFSAEVRRAYLPRSPPLF